MRKLAGESTQIPCVFIQALQKRRKSPRHVTKLVQEYIVETKALMEAQDG